MRNTILLSVFIKNWSCWDNSHIGRKLVDYFLHIVLLCLANHKNGMFMAILKCIILDFDKKSGYFFFIFAKYTYIQVNKTLNTCKYTHDRRKYMESVRGGGADKKKN